MNSLNCIFTQDVQSHHTLTLHARHVPTATNISQLFSKKIMKSLSNQDQNEEGWNPLAHFSTIQVTDYYCHYIVLGEIFVVIVCNEGSPIQEAERAISHAKTLIIETLGGNIKNVTIANILHLSNYSQIVLSLDELLYNSDLHHTPKRELEWANGQNKILQGGKFLISGPLTTTIPPDETRKYNSKLKKSKSKLDDTELYTSGLNWQREFRRLKIHEDKLKQLNEFDVDISNLNSQEANDDLFDDTWNTPMISKQASKPSVSESQSPLSTPVKNVRTIETQSQVKSVDQENLTLRGRREATDIKRENPMMGSLDLLKVDNTNSEIASSKSFSDEESISTPGSYLSSPIISQNATTYESQSPYSSKSNFSDLSNSFQNSDTKFTLRFIEKLLTNISENGISDFQYKGEISIILNPDFTISEPHKFTLCFPDYFKEDIYQFDSNHKVCRPSKTNSIQFNCLLTPDLLQENKPVPILRYTYLQKSHNPVLIQAKRKITDNICKMMIEYSINPNNRPQNFQLKINPFPSNSIQVQKVQIKPYEQGSISPDNREIIFKIPTNVNTGKLMIQYTFEKNIESILDQMSPILGNLSNFSNQIIPISELEVKVFGSNTTVPLSSVYGIQTNVQAKCKVDW